jgi:hypothetical protein
VSFSDAATSSGFLFTRLEGSLRIKFGRSYLKPALHNRGIYYTKHDYVRHSSVLPKHPIELGSPYYIPPASQSNGQGGGSKPAGRKAHSKASKQATGSECYELIFCSKLYCSNLLGVLSPQLLPAEEAVICTTIIFMAYFIVPSAYSKQRRRIVINEFALQVTKFLNLNLVCGEGVS